MNKEVENAVKNLTVDRSKDIDTVQTFLKDASIDLEERWGVFKKVHNSLPRSLWVEYPRSLPDFGEISLHDDFRYDRYQVCVYSHIVELMEDRDDKFTKEDVIAMKKFVVESGYGSFENDW